MLGRNPPRGQRLNGEDGRRLSIHLPPRRFLGTHRAHLRDVGSARLRIYERIVIQFDPAATASGLRLGCLACCGSSPSRSRDPAGAWTAAASRFRAPNMRSLDHTRHVAARLRIDKTG